MATNPSPQRQDNRVLVTPLVADLLVCELMEMSRQFPPGEDFPYAYGTLYSVINASSTNYPEHILTFAERADEQGLWWKVYYAADRDLQETYGFSISYPYAGNTKYPQITRPYILRRGELPLDLGSADPGNPYTPSDFLFVSADGLSYFAPLRLHNFSLWTSCCITNTQRGRPCRSIRRTASLRFKNLVYLRSVDQGLPDHPWK